MTPEERDEKALQVGREVAPAMNAMLDIWIERGWHASADRAPQTERERMLWSAGALFAYALVVSDGDQDVANALLRRLVADRLEGK